MLTDEHHAVNTMIDQGTAFDQIEDYIDGLALPGEQLSALWLLAWAEATDAATRRRVVAETLAVVDRSSSRPLPRSARKLSRNDCRR